MFAHRINTRRSEAALVRQEASRLADEFEFPLPVNNGEEASYQRGGQPSYVGNYSKGLRHNGFGEVLRPSYDSLLRALDSRDPRVFEQIQVGSPSGLNLTNPQSGVAFDLQGPDAAALLIPPAPRIDQPEASGEMGELYWMALLRDVAFIDYGTGANTDADPNINTTIAAASLTNDFSVFRGPRDAGGNVTPATLFRGFTPGDVTGPFISQFLLLGTADPILGPAASNGFIRYGTLRIDQRQKTAAPGVDFLTEFNTPATPHWLGAQNGRNDLGNDQFDNQRRFIRSLRDMATYVHFDALYEAYLNACVIMLNIPVPFDLGNPYVRSRTQDGFGTFGGPHILSLLTEVATRALKAEWWQKWFVHRRLRPEEFGGRIHVHRNVAAGRYPFIDSEILNSNVINLVEAGFGTTLLPQAFPEGCPTHPAYGSGHATVAGACVSLLKAFFDESFVIPTPVQSDRNGANLLALPAGTALTVGDELNKLAANISIGRNAAGVHWRSDYTEALRLGEKIAVELLREQKLTYNEDHHLTVTRFDGTGIVI
jgi:membrane-associated phospholipid phosphatase